MEAAATAGLRLGSAAVAPLVKKLFHPGQPGAGLVGEPVRISSLVSFRGEKRTMTRHDLEKLAQELVNRAVHAAGPHDTPVSWDRQAVALALADTLTGLGNLDMNDVQAVQLGPEGLAKALRPHRRDGLSYDAELLHDRLLQVACLHIIDFFTTRSTFVARTLVEQSRQNQRLVQALDLLVERLPARHTADAAFEERYRGHLVRRYSQLSIFGIDVDEDWPLDAAYLSLETTDSDDRPTSAAPEDERYPRPSPPQRAEQALSGHERVLLRGVAGAGKTTLLQWLAVTTAEHRPSGGLVHLYGRVPFILPLRTLTRAGGGDLPAPRDFLSAVGCPHTPPAGWAERVLTAGRALLLVDGIDEVPEPQRNRTRWWLRELLGAFPGNVCLVTSRPSAVREDWLAADSFRELSLSPMRQEDVTTFIERWHCAARAGQDRADALLAAVRSRQDLNRLATNPLMCGLICALHRTSHGYLPRGREELYEAALRMLLERRDRQRAIEHGPQLDTRSQSLLLERLAYWLIRNGHSQMERYDAVELIAQILPSMNLDASDASAEDVYRHLLNRSGLLREPADGVVDFVHRTFQDYLAARAVVENRDFPLLVRNAHLDQWEDVVRMAVAHGRPDERKRLLQQLVKRGDAVRKHRVRLHLLAMACLEHATQLDPDVRREVQERAAALIPPRTYGEATSLAAVGHVALELLPGPEGLTDDEAAAVVHVANALGTDAALPKLAEFRAHPSPKVRASLLSRWSSFDPQRFRAKVLTGLPDTAGQRLRVETPTELAVLRALPDYSCLSLFGEFSEEEIVEVGKTRALTALSLDGRRLVDLGFLRLFPTLEQLSLIDGPAITDLSPVTELPLHDLLLRKMPGVHDLRPLNALPHLRYLFIGDGMACPDLKALPARAPLNDLGLPSTATDLRGIGAWQELKTLRILSSDSSPSRESLAAIADLPSLTSLVVTARLLQALHDRRIVLPGVNSLHLIDTEEVRQLRDLVTVLPGLRNLLMGGGPAELDVSPLRDLEMLDSVRAQGKVRLTQVDRLPKITVTQPLDSRY